MAEPESFMLQVRREFQAALIGNPVWAAVFFDNAALPDNLDSREAVQALMHTQMALYLIVLRVAAEIDKVRAERMQPPE